MKTFKQISITLLVASASLSSCKKYTGCTDPIAKNYTALAEVDDGSCIYPKYGCTDRNALNYDPGADHDNKTCVYPAGYVVGSLSNGVGVGSSSGSGSFGMPVQEQNCFVFEYTAKWCGPCGDWGAPAFDALLDHSPKVRGMTIHNTDPMSFTSLENVFNQHFPTGGGIPSHYVADIESYATSDVDAVLARTPVANTSFGVIKNTSDFQVKGKVKFFQDGGADEYFVAIYIVEDHIAGGSANGASAAYLQLGTNDPNYEHHKVSRACISGKVMGNSLGSNIANGTLTTFDETISLDPSWNKNNLEVITVLWRKDSAGKYFFVNCN